MSGENGSNRQRNAQFERLEPGKTLRISGFRARAVEDMFVNWAREWPEFGDRSYHFAETKYCTTHITLVTRTDGIAIEEWQARISAELSKFKDTQTIQEFVIDSAGFEPIANDGGRTLVRASRLGWEIGVGEEFSCSMFPKQLRQFGLAYMRKRGLDQAYRAERAKMYDKQATGTVVPGWIVTRIR